MINILGIGHQWYLITQSKRDKANELLVAGLHENGIDYKIDVQTTKSPRIEVRWVDSLEREWQGPTLTIDKEIPKIHSLQYLGSDKATHQPVMITLSILGSLERCIALLLEKYKGQLPPSLFDGTNGDQKTFESK